MFSSLVCGSTGIRPFVCDRPLVDPIEKPANLFAPESLDRHSASPFRPLPQNRLVLLPSAARRPPGAKGLCPSSFEGRRHWRGSSAETTTREQIVAALAQADWITKRRNGPVPRQEFW